MYWKVFASNLNLSVTYNVQPSFRFCDQIAEAYVLLDTSSFVSMKYCSDSADITDYNVLSYRAIVM